MNDDAQREEAERRRRFSEMLRRNWFPCWPIGGAHAMPLDMRVTGPLAQHNRFTAANDQDGFDLE